MADLCGDCKHWETPVRPGEFGTCRRIPLDDSHHVADPYFLDDGSPEREEFRSAHKAATIAGSGGSAYLCTRPDFGCVLFEPKELQDRERIAEILRDFALIMMIGGIWSLRQSAGRL